MNTVQKDLNYIFSDKKKGDFAYLYSRTNEDLKRLFEIIDVRNKNVLSVLSSSDYLFSALYKGAGNIETFDINYSVSKQRKASEIMIYKKSNKPICGSSQN